MVTHRRGRSPHTGKRAPRSSERTSAATSTWSEGESSRCPRTVPPPWQAGGMEQRDGRRMGPQGWDRASSAPLVLVAGPEPVLAERAIAAIIADVRSTDGTVSVTRLSAANYASGALRAATSPSLFCLLYTSP